MQDIIPSNNRLKQEIIEEMLLKGNLDQLLIEEKELKQKLKQVQELIKDRKTVVVEEMVSLDIESVPLGDDYYIEMVKGSTRQKLISFAKFKKTYPQFLEDNPQSVTETTVKPYIKIRSI